MPPRRPTPTPYYRAYTEISIHKRIALKSCATYLEVSLLSKSNANLLTQPAIVIHLIPFLIAQQELKRLERIIRQARECEKSLKILKCLQEIVELELQLEGTCYGQQYHQSKSCITSLA